MTRSCIALLSGGLDSMLAIRLMQDQGIAVEAVNFKTLFSCCQETAGRAAQDLGVRITVLGAEDDYLELVKSPRFGYGKGANPCVDCRIYMFQRAYRFMEQVGADFIVSGEVIGQRPMSQKRRDLETISHHSALDDLLLRPLSPPAPTPNPSRAEGWVTGSGLFDFCGRSRKGLIALPANSNFNNIPSPSTGCALTEPHFARKVTDLIQLDPAAGMWDYDLLKLGRHFRLNGDTKVVVGRQKSENDQLEYLHDLPQASSTAVLTPLNFQGPLSLVVGPATPAALDFSGGLVLRYSKFTTDQQPSVMGPHTTSNTFRSNQLSRPRVSQARTLQRHLEWSSSMRSQPVSHNGLDGPCGAACPISTHRGDPVSGAPLTCSPPINTNSSTLAAAVTGTIRSVVARSPSPAARKFTRTRSDVWTTAHARFQKISRSRGEWKRQPGVESRWPCQFGPIQVELRTTPSGQIGVFPEQWENWNWLAGQLAKSEPGIRVLNLFAYTGVSSLIAARCGAQVVHLDAASNVVAWARDNAQLSGLGQQPIRWIVEDVQKFARREHKRGNQYDAIILDPPSFGHGPKGQQWHLENHLPALLQDCLALTAGAPRFVLLTCHTSGVDAAQLTEALQRAGIPAGGCLESTALALTTNGGRRLASGVVARWAKRTETVGNQDWVRKDPLP